MGNCCSSAATEPPPSPIPPPLPPSHPTPHPPNSSIVPVNPVRPHESDPAPDPPQSDGRTSSKLPHRQNSAPVPSDLSSATSTSPHNGAMIGGSPVYEGETPQKSLPEFRRSNPSFSSHNMTRSFSVDTPRDGARNVGKYKAQGAPPSSFRGGGHGDGSGNDTVPVRHASPRAIQRAATMGNNTSSLHPTVREVLPDGFRYALQP